MKSITYYLTHFILKLKGVKKEFAITPINYLKLRKQDVHNPKVTDFKPNNLKQFTVENTVITEITPIEASRKLIIFIHGGAFVYGPTQLHWDAAKTLITVTQCTIWMIDYPKAPENKIDVISHNIDEVYKTALSLYPSHQIILLGDSVGGTLASSLTQRLITKALPLPALLVLISPVMHCAFTNPEIIEVEKRDPLLSISGGLSAKKMCALNDDLEDQRMSPINGSFKNFPKTILFTAENDMTYPDQKLAADRMIEDRVKLKIAFGSAMPHIWPLLSMMKEGKTALAAIAEEIKQM